MSGRGAYQIEEPATVCSLAIQPCDSASRASAATRRQFRLWEQLRWALEAESCDYPGTDARGRASRALRL